MAMEGGKGVMMSERPSGGGGTDSGAGAGVSIGNYKGVMLCNRPFAGATAGAHSAGGSDKPAPFVTGINKEGLHPRGWDPSKRERKNTVPERSYKNTALSKHKQWLRSLQKERDRAVEAELQAEEEKKRKHEAFLAQQQKMRDVVRGLAEVDSSGNPRTTGDGIAGSDFDANAQERALQSGILTAAQQKKLASKAKPAWAYTEAGKEAEEEADADELLKFAESLDFEAYMDDLDVRAAMEQAKAQLDALEAERKEELQAEAAEEQARLAELGDAELGGESKGEGKEEGGKVVALTAASLRQFDEAQPAFAETKNRELDAETVMSRASAAESIRSVHSKKSLQAVINREKSKAATMPVISETVEPPRIVVHDDTNGARMQKKGMVSQLPYMNRNPAV